MTIFKHIVISIYVVIRDDCRPEYVQYILIALPNTRSLEYIKIRAYIEQVGICTTL